jgi:hypothetical protein
MEGSDRQWEDRPMTARLTTRALAALFALGMLAACDQGGGGTPTQGDAPGAAPTTAPSADPTTAPPVGAPPSN